MGWKTIKAAESRDPGLRGLPTTPPTEQLPLTRPSQLTTHLDPPTRAPPTAKMGPSHLLTTALLTLATAATISPRAPAAPRLVSVSYSGNGCDPAANTVTGSMSRLSLTFPDFVAQLGSSDFRASNRNCNAFLSIDEGVPGFQLAVRRISGEASFFGSAGVGLAVHSTAFWQDNADHTVSLVLFLFIGVFVFFFWLPWGENLVPPPLLLFGIW